MITTRLPSLTLVALIATLVVACSSSSGDSAGSGTKVKDQRGDTCTVPIHASFTITCDQTPVPSKACTGGATACWTYADPFPPNSGRICASCCSGSTASSVTADCSNIVCTTSQDCPSGGTCTKGGCY